MLSTGCEQGRRFKQSGLTASISAPALSALQSAAQVAAAAGKTKDPRMQALAAASTALSAKDAVSGARSLAQDLKNAGVNLNISLGSSPSDSQTDTTSTTTEKDNSGALKKNWNGQQLMQDVQAQVIITQKALPQLADFTAKQMNAKATELRNAGNTAEAEKYKEGGVYRVAAHVALGALSGGTAGALGAGASAAIAPTGITRNDAESQ